MNCYDYRKKVNWRSSSLKVLQFSEATSVDVALADQATHTHSGSSGSILTNEPPRSVVRTPSCRISGPAVAAWVRVRWNTHTNHFAWRWCGVTERESELCSKCGPATGFECSLDFCGCEAIRLSTCLLRSRLARMPSEGVSDDATVVLKPLSVGGCQT